MSVYISTRNKDHQAASHTAIVKGLSDDGGLYTPYGLDFRLDLNQLTGQSYQETAKTILSGFFTDFSKEDIDACVDKAYDSKFRSADIVPVTKLKSGYLMELYHGPTCAFKDLALTILPHLLTTAYRMDHRNETVAILTATSGDTGKAALSGFCDVENTAVTVFYPEIGVSNIQKTQMITAPGKNVKVIAVKGNFDDCQKMVKEAVSSQEVKDACDGVIISSANSINIGRLVPQIVYYCTTYAKLVKANEIKLGDAVNFIVPTGNFGDILAGYLAKSIGLPIHKLICASNTNNVLTDFLKTGTYDTHRDFYATISPSMDILVSSNLERLLFMESDYDDSLVKQLMNDLKEKGKYTVSDALLAKIQADFAGYWTSEEDCRKAIHDLYVSEGVLIDPHTSVALAAMDAYQKETGDSTPCVVLSTASPYKFTASVLEALEKEVPENDFDAMRTLSALTSTTIPQPLADLEFAKPRFSEVIAVEDGMHVIAARMKEIAHG